MTPVKTLARPAGQAAPAEPATADDDFQIERF
jgi:hypothetical protein